jgi:hypothetical protein
MMMSRIGSAPSYFYAGLDQKLVGVEGAEPIRDIIM